MPSLPLSVASRTTSSTSSSTRSHQPPRPSLAVVCPACAAAHAYPSPPRSGSERKQPVPLPSHIHACDAPHAHERHGHGYEHERMVLDSLPHEERGERGGKGKERERESGPLSPPPTHLLAPLDLPAFGGSGSGSRLDTTLEEGEILEDVDDEEDGHEPPSEPPPPPPPPPLPNLVPFPIGPSLPGSGTTHAQSASFFTAEPEPSPSLTSFAPVIEPAGLLHLDTQWQPKPVPWRVTSSSPVPEPGPSRSRTDSGGSSTSLKEAMLRSPAFYPQNWLPDEDEPVSGGSWSGTDADMDMDLDLDGAHQPYPSPASDSGSSALYLSPTHSDPSSLSPSDLRTPTDSDFFISPSEEDDNGKHPSSEFWTLGPDRAFASQSPTESPNRRGFVSLFHDELSDDDLTPSTVSPASPSRRGGLGLPELEFDMDMAPESPSRRTSLELPGFDADGSPSSPSRRSSLDLPELNLGMDVAPSSPSRRPSFDLPSLDTEADVSRDDPSRADMPFVPEETSSAVERAPLGFLASADYDQDFLPPSPVGLVHLGTPSPGASGELPSGLDVGLGLFPGAAAPTSDSPLPDDALLRSLSIDPASLEPDSELARLCALRARALQHERAERKAEAQLADRLARLARALLDPFVLAPPFAAAIDGAQETRRELQTVMGLRADAKKRRKKYKERAREVGALLTLARSLGIGGLGTQSRKNDHDDGEQGEGAEMDVEDKEPVKVVSGGGTVKGPTKNMAQLAARMLFGRREAAVKPLVGARGAAPLYIRSALSRHGSTEDLTQVVEEHSKEPDVAWMD